MNPDIGTTEDMMIESGYPQLTGEEMAQMIVGKTIFGDYAQMFKYIVSINANGTMEGRNNVGSHHSGKWLIDKENNTFTVYWDGGWDNNTARAYLVEGIIKLYDNQTGQWRTTFTDFLDGSQHPLKDSFYAGS